MLCSGCSAGAIQYEVKIDTAREGVTFDELSEFLADKGKRAEIHQGASILLEEAAMRDFVDFCSDHVRTDSIRFRVGESDWKPLEDAASIMDAEWIDGIIAAQSVRFDFQPIVDGDKQVYGYECLARFRDSNGTAVSPGAAFKAARDRGRLYALDRMCRLGAVRASVHVGTKVFINFVPTSIYSPEFCLKSTVALANSLGVSPSTFVFEVVETEKVEDIEHLKTVLAYYRDKGFSYALDDVGEGYSTIELLAELRPHYMKLDMKYAQGVAADSDKQQVALVFLRKAQQLGSVPLAEGIEEEADFQWLKTQGYRLFQGYGLGRPGPLPHE
jgi:EAL domain-containing protein (putative c-di-GMP-specific phosphodiesterase class I)